VDDAITVTGRGENAIVGDSAGCIIAALTATGDSVIAAGGRENAVVVDCIIAGSTARVIYPIPLQPRHNMGGPRNAIASDRCGNGEK